MPRERESRRGSLYYNALSRHSRLTPSQPALIAIRTYSPKHNSEGSPQLPSSPPHIPPLIPGSPPIGEEMPPPKEITPLLNYPLAPPKIHPQDQVFGTGNCIMEEEIPPSSQVEDHTTSVGEETEAKPPLLSPNRLSNEQLQIIFEIRQKQDEQLHIQHILDQRMDILFDALADAPTQNRCPTCDQKFIPTYNIHSNPKAHRD